VSKSKSEKRGAEAEVVEAVERIASRERALLQGARANEGTFETAEGVVVDWLFRDHDADFATFRRRFEHGISAADEDTMAKVRALVGLVVEAIVENTGDTLRDSAAFFDKLMGLSGEQARIVRAFRLFMRAGVEDGAMLIFLLGAIDPRYRALDGDDVREALVKRKHDERRPKGGRGHRGNSGLLGALTAQVGAFDVASAQESTTKIRRALEKHNKSRARSKKARKTAKRP